MSSRPDPSSQSSRPCRCLSCASWHCESESCSLVHHDAGRALRPSLLPRDGQLDCPWCVLPTLRWFYGGRGCARVSIAACSAARLDMVSFSSFPRLDLGNTTKSRIPVWGSRKRVPICGEVGTLWMHGCRCIVPSHIPMAPCDPGVLGRGISRGGDRALEYTRSESL
jgi:hypothetical protein